MVGLQQNRQNLSSVESGAEVRTQILQVRNKPISEDLFTKFSMNDLYHFVQSTTNHISSWPVKSQMCFVRLRLNECLSLCLYGVAFSNVNNFDVWDVRTYGCYLSASSIVDTKVKQTLSKHGKLYLQELCMSPMHIIISQRGFSIN